MGDETEEAFSCYLVQNLMERKVKVASCRHILEKHLGGMISGQHEQTFNQLLRFASAIENHFRMKWLFDVFHQLIENKILSARLVIFGSSTKSEIIRHYLQYYTFQDGL